MPGIGGVSLSLSTAFTGVALDAALPAVCVALSKSTVYAAVAGAPENGTRVTGVERTLPRYCAGTSGDGVPRPIDEPVPLESDARRCGSPRSTDARRSAEAASVAVASDTSSSCWDARRVALPSPRDCSFVTVESPPLLRRR